MPFCSRQELAGKFVEDVIVDVAVSVDRSWQIWYGHNSLLGMVFVMSIDTGCVLDYSVKSLFAKNAFEEWKKTHAPNCAVNHVGSSGAMERDGAIEIFTCSIEKHNRRYTTYVGDGDSSSYVAVKKATEDKYEIIHL